jgi:hypothetical protein
MKELACELESKLTALKQIQANNFAPARFVYIATLLAKAQTAKQSVSEALKQKVESALSSYQQDFNNAHLKAQTLAEQIIEQHPKASAQVQLLMLNCQFDELDKLANKQQHIEPSLFAALNNYINQEQDQAVDNPQESFSDMLNLIESKAVMNSQRPSQQTAISKTNKAAELKSFNSFKQFKEKYDTDKLVEQMITLRPENLGPLNPHMLLIRSLESLRELSPQYLSRFVTYIDAILRLEDTTSAAKKIKAPK